MYSRVSKEEIELFKELALNNKTFKEISKITNRNEITISRILKKEGINAISKSKLKRKYNFNEYYFHKIDTEHKAYFLGLLVADGYHSIKNYQITIVLQEEDGYILYKFHEDLDLKKDPKWNHRKYKQEIHKQKPTYSSVINSQILSENLLKLGIDNNKSKSLDFNFEQIIPEKLIRHFIRGFFDGDGTVFYDRGRIIFGFCGTHLFMDKLNNYLIKKLNLSNNKIIKRNIISIIRFSKKKDIKIFYDYLYSNSNVYLKRKFNKFNFVPS